MSDSKGKIHQIVQIVCRLGLCSTPRLGSLQCSL